MDREDERRIDRLASRAPGDDPADPYGDVEVESLPNWWRRAVREFEEHGLRPYRPPQFEDGVRKHEVTAELERTLGVEIRFARVSPEREERWTVYVDGSAAGKIGQRRSPDGYSVFDIGSDEFASLVRSAAASSDD